LKAGLADRPSAPLPERRAQIAGAAATLFAQYGYETTTVRQIADRVGMLAGSLYNHFPNKEEMLHAVMRGNVARLEAENLRIAALPADAEQRLLANAIVRIHHYVEHWQFHTILLQEGQFFERNPEFAYVVTGKERVAAVQTGMLREGIETGLFRPGIDTRLMIGTISRMLSGMTEWHRTSEGTGDRSGSGEAPRYTLDAMIDFHLDSLLHLVRTRARLDAPVPRAECERLVAALVGEAWSG
jgi:TetR/AcrR family transcriptional regulator, cholesterol catabolism regulator